MQQKGLCILQLLGYFTLSHSKVLNVCSFWEEDGLARKNHDVLQHHTLRRGFEVLFLSEF